MLLNANRPSLTYFLSSVIADLRLSIFGFDIEDGNIRRCKRILKLLNAQYGEVLGHTHNYTEVVTAPTCATKGYTTYTCECGDSYVADETTALGHDYSEGACRRCGEMDPDYQKPTDPVENPFTDVKGEDYFLDPVLWAVEKGITLGTSAEAFSPNNPCTRAQIVTFLWRANGSPEPESDENPFTDVAATDYFYKAVLWAVENKITMGMSATTFGPNAICNRGQVATFLCRR